MQQLVVEIPHRQYPIFVAEGLLADTQKLRELLLARIQGRQVAIITNKVVAPLYLDALLEALDGLQVDCLLYTSPSPRDCDRSRMPSSA